MHKRMALAAIAGVVALFGLAACDRPVAKPASQQVAVAAPISTAPASPNGAAAAPRPNGPETVKLFEDWRVACPTAKDQSCAMRQGVLDATSHKEMARLEIFRDHGADVLLVTLPFNVLLEPGMAYGFDEDKPVLVPFETCTNIGCVSRAPFTGELADGFIKAREARILFAGLDAKPVGLPFFKKGFDEALADYRREETARGQ